MILFDLDGTLVDTVADIAAAMNHALGVHGLPGLPIATYRRIVGEGLRRLAERALAELGRSDDLGDELVTGFRLHYRDHLLDASRPYPGIPELLGTLTERGVRLAVLSNKPDEPTQRIVRALFPSVPFATVHGERAGVPRKPDPTSALAIVHPTPPAECTLVGDTPIDISTARAAGMRAVAVSWGFTPVEQLRGADLLLDAPHDLLRSLR